MDIAIKLLDEALPIHNHVTVDLGIRQFKKLMKQRVKDHYLPKRYFSDVIRDFKKRQWKMYHDAFPEDNSSHPTHTHLAIDKLDLV